jgi:hypothetical protein
MQKSRLERRIVPSRRCLASPRLANGGLEVARPAGLDLEERPVFSDRISDGKVRTRCSRYQGAEERRPHSKLKKVFLSY